LSVFPVQVPPLRKRGDDVIMLALHFLEQVCREFGRPCPSLNQAQVQSLRDYDWPGNVRELRNIIERALILSKGSTLRLDLSLSQAALEEAPAESADMPSDEKRAFVTDAEMKERVRANLVAALESADWRISGVGGAADLLGIRPSTLSDRVRAMGIRRPGSE
jgi:transcriptional regulator with GAF, ATPase, and Fis domain